MKNIQTGLQDSSEEDIEAAISALDSLYRLDPVFPYNIIPFPWESFGLDASGVDIPFSDTTLE